GDTFEADWLYLDLRTGEGRLEKATIRSAGELTRGHPLLFRAERARVSDHLASFAGEEAELSTCTYHVPHFALRAPAISVTTRGDAISLEEDLEPLQRRVVVERPSFEALGIPFLTLPWTLEWDTAWDRFLPRERVGRSGRFGPFLLSELPLYPGRDLDVGAKVDYMERRGVGLGGDASWHGPEGDRESYRGFFDGYYVSDGADEDKSTGLPVPQRDRWRLRAFQRDDMPLGFRRELELSWISDRAFLPEFYKGESQSGKEQETAAYARWLGDAAGLPGAANMGASLEGRWRLNAFQTQTEYLPRGRFAWVGEPVLDEVLPDRRGVYLTTGVTLDNARTRFNEELLLPENRILRADVDERADYPVPLGPIQLDPFGLARYSAWSERLVSGIPDDPLGDERGGGPAIDRFVAGAGILATTDLWRDLGGYRHIATPTVGYTNVFHEDTRPEALVWIDDLETVRTAEFVPFGMRNRLQEWRTGPGIVTGSAVDVVDWEVLARWYPRPGADNRGERWGLVRSDLRVNPDVSYGGRWRSDWDPNPGGGVVRTDAEVWCRPDPAITVALGYRYFEDVYKAVEGGLDVRFPWAEKWGARAATQYDFERESFTRHQFALRRYFHRFVLEVSFDVDYDENGGATPDFRYAATFVPLELFQRGGLFGTTEVQREVDPLF
ncbi:MAG TPA: hypothetical protein VHF22_08255, partial [Planctomycetota bacterium]|nr:hypothetical protein [Planctomycetota bacterium]